MNKRLIKFKFILLILFIGIITGFFIRHNHYSWILIKKPFIKLNEIQQNELNAGLSLAEIRSSQDNNIQKLYYYKSKSITQKPLIVSLHNWGGNYSQNDELASICKSKDLNYIHPDFRGSNQTINACCSELALADIDDAITFAIKKLNVDTSNIYVIGASGGGYATLSTFMKSKHYIKKFSAWVPITDLVAWYSESKIRNNVFAKDILKCTNSSKQLNILNAKNKSPIYWETPKEKLKHSKVSIYAGVFDGIQGSVPITHSINYYNKIISDLAIKDSSSYVSDYEKLRLLELRKPLGNYGYIEDRKVYLAKEFENVNLVIFEGGHEILYDFAINALLDE